MAKILKPCVIFSQTDCYGTPINKNEPEKEVFLKEREHEPYAELVKQIIDLDDYSLTYVTPYDGYLYIVAKSCEIYLGNNYVLPVKKHLDGLFLAKGTSVSIVAPVKVKSIRFSRVQ